MGGFLPHFSFLASPPFVEERLTGSQLVNDPELSSDAG